MDFLSQSFSLARFFRQFSCLMIRLDDGEDQAIWIGLVVAYDLPIFVVEMHGGSLEVAKEIVWKQSHLGDKSASWFWTEIFVEDRQTTKDALYVIRNARGIAVDEEDLIGACSGV